jgi:sialidase-1
MELLKMMRTNTFCARCWLPLLFVICFFSATSQSNADPFVGEKSDWKGFTRYDFEFEWKSAHVVLPTKALTGKPWIWRARFPGWHTEMDSILLSEGFHVVFINTNNQYGSPDAVATWDRFYQFLVEKYQFHDKVALEGVSRGGLFVYNWAKQNPGKVNCIYAEAPVCDFKSWPGGFGDGKGSQEDWQKLKSEYNFTSDDQAKAWDNQPMDNLQELAKARVPILHMIGLNDGVVPPAENSLLLIERYIKLGGPATIIPCTIGKQDLWGHHFPIETPRMAADFILYNTKLPNQKLSSSDFHDMRGGLKNSFLKFERGEKARVAFLGGSITYNGGWRDSVCVYLQQRFPETEFEFIAAGIPSMGTTPAAFRLARDVLTNGPVDLLFEEAAVNDAGNGRTNEEQIRAMEGIVRHIRNVDPATDIVMMHFVDPGKMEDYRSGHSPDVIQNHEKIAHHYNIPTINLAKEVTERIDAEEFTWEDDFINLHPSPFGQGIYAHSMITFLENASSLIDLDDDKVTDHPEMKKIDDACYDKGSLIPAEQIKLANGWYYEKNWAPTDGAGTRQNYKNVPMLIGESPGKILKFKFKGTAVGIAVAAGPDAGIIEYRIDKGEWKKQDLFTLWSSQLHLPWYYTLGAGLNSGNHVLQLRVSKQKNPHSKGNTCRLRYFFVNE